MKCSNCGREDTVRTAIKNGKLLKDMCDRCLASYQGYADYARKFERDSQRRTYAKDILQKWEGDKLNPSYVDAYPEQFDGTTRRDYGVDQKQY